MDSISSSCNKLVTPVPCQRFALPVVRFESHATYIFFKELPSGENIVSLKFLKYVLRKVKSLQPSRGHVWNNWKEFLWMNSCQWSAIVIDSGPEPTCNRIPYVGHQWKKGGKGFGIYGKVPAVGLGHVVSRRPGAPEIENSGKVWTGQDQLTSEPDSPEGQISSSKFRFQQTGSVVWDSWSWKQWRPQPKPRRNMKRRMKSVVLTRRSWNSFIKTLSDFKKWASTFRYGLISDRCQVMLINNGMPINRISRNSRVPACTPLLRSSWQRKRYQ